MTVDELVETIEKTGWRVDTYRCPDGEWVVKLASRESDVPDVSVKRPSLASAFAEAAELPGPLPVYPRRPPVVAAERMWAVKENGGWKVDTPGGWVSKGFKTKRAAEVAIPRFAERMADAAAEWDAEYAPKVAGKVEGIDFRWRSW